jgi:glycosyltransferase involved in cell wall biosynthesis
MNTEQSLTINLMTAGLAPGDAISNYIFSKARLLRDMGARVNIYADAIHPRLASAASHASLYRPTGEALLWFHFSIYSDNVEIARKSRDYKIMDYHGICPPHLFSGQNEHLRFLCQSGIEILPDFVGNFDQFIVHTEYTRQQLLTLGCPQANVHRIFLPVDTSHFGQGEDETLAVLLRQLDYLLFVGRVVPQKDIVASLEIFAALHQERPDMVFLLVGSREQTPRYQRQLDRLVRQLNLEGRVMFLGQVNDPAQLAALFNNATFYLATSEWESFCVPLAESLFFGVPTVIHDVAPLPEVAGPAGIVVDKQKPADAAARILAVLADADRYTELRETALRWSQQYTDEALARNLAGFLQHIAGQRARVP